jgi:hypothetical protein
MLSDNVEKFLSHEELEECSISLKNDSFWKWRYNTGDYPFWIFDIWQRTDFLDGKHIPVWREGTRKIWKDIFNKVSSHAGTGFVPWRFIINGQNRDLDGGLHRDWPEVEQKGYTYLIYLNRTWDQSWGGATEFYNNNNVEEIAAEIFPEPGKLICYKGSILHRGRSPLVSKKLRVTLAIQGKYN